MPVNQSRQPEAGGPIAGEVSSPAVGQVCVGKGGLPDGIVGGRGASGKGGPIPRWILSTIGYVTSAAAGIGLALLVFRWLARWLGH